MSHEPPDPFADDMRAELAKARAFGDAECAARMQAQAELALARAALAKLEAERGAWEVAGNAADEEHKAERLEAQARIAMLHEALESWRVNFGTIDDTLRWMRRRAAVLTTTAERVAAWRASVESAALAKFMLEETCEQCEAPLARTDDEGVGLPKAWFCLPCWNAMAKRVETAARADERAKCLSLPFGFSKEGMAQHDAQVRAKTLRDAAAHFRSVPHHVSAPDGDSGLVAFGNIAADVLDSLAAAEPTVGATGVERALPVADASRGPHKHVVAHKSIFTMLHEDGTVTCDSSECWCRAPAAKPEACRGCGGTGRHPYGPEYARGDACPICAGTGLAR